MAEWETGRFGNKSHVWGKGRHTGWAMIRRSLCGLSENDIFLTSVQTPHCKNCERVLDRQTQEK